MYCLAPLHHSSSLLAAIGGAVAGGSRIALSRGLDPERFAEEVHRYGVTVVSYTWTMMREILDAENLALDSSHPVRLFIGSGMPQGLWRRDDPERFAPAKVLEFYASTEGDVVLANVAGREDRGAKGRPLPGSAEVRLAGLRSPSPAGCWRTRQGFNPGMPRTTRWVCFCKGPGVPRRRAVPGGAMRGSSPPATRGYRRRTLFRRDADGDYWLVDHRKTAVICDPEKGPSSHNRSSTHSHSPVDSVDLAVAYGAEVGGRTLAVAAFTLRDGRPPRLTEIAQAFPTALTFLALATRPDPCGGGHPAGSLVPPPERRGPERSRSSEAWEPRVWYLGSGFAAVQATDQGSGRGVPGRLGRGARRCAVDLTLLTRTVGEDFRGY